MCRARRRRDCGMDAITKPKRKSATVSGRAYPDLHDHVRALAREAAARRVDAPINKDTEMHPLVRWQFRGGIPEHERKAFLFTNVDDARAADTTSRCWSAGSPPTARSTASASACRSTRSARRGSRAIADPIPPRVVDEAPCQEVVHHRQRPRRRGQGARRHCRCRSRRPAGTTRPTLTPRTSSPRTRTPASRTWATTAARLKAPDGGSA